MADEYLLSMTDIGKQFPGVCALDNVQLKVRKGTVHGLMGENGAGKSTLMKCLIGMYTPDSGTIIFKGAKIIVRNTHAALAQGISMIHQELNPIPHMTIAENIFLGRETRTWYGLVDMKKMNQRTKALLDRLAIKLDPNTKMVALSIANTQLIEIAKAVSYDSDLIVMDEPTSAITEAEVSVLFKIIRSLKESGRSIIYITHKLDEVFEITDEITVFRDGKYISTDPTQTLTRDLLIQKMVGRELTEMFHKEPAKIGETVLEARGPHGLQVQECQLRGQTGRNLRSCRTHGRGADRTARGRIRSNQTGFRGSIHCREESRDPVARGRDPLGIGAPDRRPETHRTLYQRDGPGQYGNREYEIVYAGYFCRFPQNHLRLRENARAIANQNAEPRPNRQKPFRRQSTKGPDLALAVDRAEDFDPGRADPRH